MNYRFFNSHQIHSLALISAIGIGLGWNMEVRAEETADEGHLIQHHIAGIDIDGGITWILQATDGAAQNITALSYTLDIGLQAPVSRNGKVIVALEAGDGKGVDPVIQPLSNANYDAFYTNLTSVSPGSTNVVVPSVSQAYYEGDYMDGAMVVNVGKLDVHSQFDNNAYANDETDQFMSAIFVRSSGTSYAELANYYAPGIALEYAMSKMIDLSVVAANGNSDSFDNVFDYMYLVGQINFKPRFGGQEGNYRFYALSDARYHAFTKINTGKTTTNTAWGLSFDQSLGNGMGLFLRYSEQDDSIAENLVKSSWSLGTLLQGTLWGRDKDTFGIGYGSVDLNDKTNLVAAVGTNNTGDESHLETFYKIGFSDHFTLTADLQIINNIGGKAAADTVTVAGLRGQLNF